MTESELAEIEARAAAASEGPWRATKPPYGNFGSGEGVLYGNSLICSTAWLGNPQENAEFIAAARTDVPKLVEAVRRLRAVVTRIATQLRDESPGCQECVGEYGSTASYFAGELEEALK